MVAYIFVAHQFYGAAVFCVTGITLNHPTWLGAGEQVSQEYSGRLSLELLGEAVDHLQVAEGLRSAHALKGRVAQFEVSPADCLIVFKSPGYLRIAWWIGLAANTP